MALTTTTLLNGLKSLFGASSSAPASNSRIPYCNSSNEVTGSTSLTDLASVLGVLGATYTEGKWIEKNSYSALEDVPPGLYGTSNGDVITWLPNNDSLYWILLVLGNKRQRIAICFKSDSTLLYITNMFSPGTAYKAWKQITVSSLS